VTEETITAMVELWQQRLGLSLWSVHVEFIEQESSHATNERSTQYDRATLQFGRHLLTDDGQLPGDGTMTITAVDRERFIESTVVHELLHCVFRDISDVPDLIESQLHRDVDSVYGRVFDRVTEQTIDKLAVALVRAFYKETT
jgi:hypothetical protein